MAHNESLSIPIISEESANKLLHDVGLDPRGREEQRDDAEGAHITVYNRTKIMVREQAFAIKITNAELLRRIDQASRTNFPTADSLRKTFITGLMSTLRAFNHQLGPAFITYLESLDATGLSTFERTLVRNPRLQPYEDLLDEVLHGPELPHDETHLRRAIDIMSLAAVSTDFGEKVRVGAALGYLAFTVSVRGPEVSPNQSALPSDLVNMVKNAHIINSGSVSSPKASN